MLESIAGKTYLFERIDVVEYAEGLSDQDKQAVNFWLAMTSGFTKGSTAYFAPDGTLTITPVKGAPQTATYDQMGTVLTFEGLKDCTGGYISDDCVGFTTTLKATVCSMVYRLQ